jgi:hypothetical protein
VSVCFYKCAAELDARAGELESADAWDEAKRLASARTLRELACQIRADTGPCADHPSCGCAAGPTSRPRPNADATPYSSA